MRVCAGTDIFMGSCPLVFTVRPHIRNMFSSVKTGTRQNTPAGRKPRRGVLLFNAASGAAVRVIVRKAVLLRREELVNGEADFFKQIAGIVLNGAYALLFGYAEVVGGNKQLNIALQLDNGEQAKGNINPALLVAAYDEAVVEHTANAVGNVAKVNYIVVVVFAAAVVYFRNLNSKGDGVNDLCW